MLVGDELTLCASEELAILDRMTLTVWRETYEPGEIEDNYLVKVDKKEKKKRKVCA